MPAHKGIAAATNAREITSWRMQYQRSICASMKELAISRLSPRKRSYFDCATTACRSCCWNSGGGFEWVSSSFQLPGTVRLLETQIDGLKVAIFCPVKTLRTSGRLHSLFVIIPIGSAECIPRKTRFPGMPQMITRCAMKNRFEAEPVQNESSLKVHIFQAPTDKLFVETVDLFKVAIP